MPKSPEYPKYPKSPEFPKSPECSCVSCVSVSPVSEGQGLDKELEKELRGLATRNACTRSEDVSEKKRFKLARSVSGFQVKLGRKLDPAELKQVLSEWYRLSQSFLNPAETCDDHFTMFLAELAKVREPAREDDKLEKALEDVSKLSVEQLPTISGWPNAPEEHRRIAALHRELSRVRGGTIYFLDYRSAAKACNGLNHQKAHTITGALVTLGVIGIVSKGKAGLNSRQAAEFRYLLPQNAGHVNDDPTRAAIVQ
jgi:hypothetical protein